MSPVEAYVICALLWSLSLVFILTEKETPMSMALLSLSMPVSIAAFEPTQVAGAYMLLFLLWWLAGFGLAPEFLLGKLIPPYGRLLRVRYDDFQEEYFLERDYDCNGFEKKKHFIARDGSGEYLQAARSALIWTLKTQGGGRHADGGSGPPNIRAPPGREALSRSKHGAHNHHGRHQSRHREAEDSKSFGLADDLQALTP